MRLHPNEEVIILSDLLCREGLCENHNTGKETTRIYSLSLLWGSFNELGFKNIALLYVEQFLSEFTINYHGYIMIPGKLTV